MLCDGGVLMRNFNPVRKDIERELVFTHTGDLRLSAVVLSGTGEVEPIPGLLYCNGYAISRTKYKRLFDMVGTTFGAGDGSTTFNLPDTRGRFLAGITDGSAGTTRITSLLLGGILGTELVALAKANIPAHIHGVGTLNITSSGAHTHSFSGSSYTQNNQDSNDFSYWSTGTGSTASAPYNGGGLTANTHNHASSEWSGNVGDGSADSLAGAGHQNVHPHQAIGGIMVAY